MQRYKLVQVFLQTLSLASTVFHFLIRPGPYSLSTQSNNSENRCFGVDLTLAQLARLFAPTYHPSWLLLKE